jgi:hypothetical protein
MVGNACHRVPAAKELCVPMPDPKYIRDLKTFTRGDVTVADLVRLEAEIYGANDRARAVMLGAVVETSLEIFLRNKTRPTLNSDDNRQLFDFRGPLGDFASKTLLAYAFNMFGPDTRHDLDLVRLLRNEFAHSRKSFDFTTPAIAAVCAQFRAPDAPGAFIPRRWLETVPHEELANASDKNHPRTRYIATCHILAERLLSNSSSLPLDAPPLDMP